MRALKIIDIQEDDQYEKIFGNTFPGRLIWNAKLGFRSAEKNRIAQGMSHMQHVFGPLSSV
jgi:hypothetical protein